MCTSRAIDNARVVYISSFYVKLASHRSLVAPLHARARLSLAAVRKVVFLSKLRRRRDGFLQALKTRAELKQRRERIAEARADAGPRRAPDP